MSMDIESLKREVLPALFRDTSRIGEYGQTEAGKDALLHSSDLMESSPVTRLAEKVGEIVAKLSDADPQRITKKANWLDRFTGKSVETHVRYHLARKTLEELMADADVLAQKVRDAVTTLNRLMQEHTLEAARLQLCVKAGREFLSENPDAGVFAEGSIEFDNPRERFSRRLANLATLLSSHEMTVIQSKLTKAQAVDLLDRWHETATVLVPVWRQHSLALLTTKHMNVEMIAAATKAHESLMKSLSEGVDRSATRH